jgi:phenylpropionate dioxygenase-like ring-hydroxylating dioxygenase large terminal subunit
VIHHTFAVRVPQSEDVTVPAMNSIASSYGQSLPGKYYSDPVIFAADLKILGETQWQLVDHSSRIPQAGDYFLYSVGTESLIFVRDRNQQIHALYNVCRHRGSRVCLDASGHVNAFVCPYHAWTYTLDGRLRGAAEMDADFDKTRFPLRSAHVGVEQGFIFVNLAVGSPPDFEVFIERTRPFISPHDFSSTKVAVRKTYPTHANWKLIVENFLECYHCKPAHATYCSVHGSDKLLAFGAGPGSASDELIGPFAAELAAWEKHAASRGFLTGMFADDFRSAYFQAASRIPIGAGYATESIGGKAVAPLLGSYSEYDCAQTAVNFNPMGYVISSSDHAVVFRFTPRGPLATDVEALWMVRATAVEGRDYQPEVLTHVWDTTLIEDKTITENNQAGVLSSQYTPGPHSKHEKRISDFVAWYVERLNSLEIPHDV